MTSTPLAQAEVAAEAIRELNHLTNGRSRGYEYPGDVYSTLLELKEAAQRMDQSLDHAGVWLQAAERRATMRDDREQFVHATVADTVGALTQGRMHARRLAQLLDEAAQHCSHLGAV